MKSFTEWRNFSRHNVEKHREPGKFSCSECDFKTNRNETLRRHKEAKHKVHQFVLSVLVDIVHHVVVGDEETVAGPSSVVWDMLDDVLADVVSRGVGADNDVDDVIDLDGGVDHLTKHIIPLWNTSSTMATKGIQ